MARGFYVNFKVPELQETLNNIGAYDRKTAQKIENQVSSSTKAIARGARQRVPVRSGDLRKSIRSSFDIKKVQGTVRAKEFYAHFVEFGAKAAVVKPSKKKELKFGTTYAKEVHVPERTERPYMRPSFEDEKPNLIRGITEAVKP